MRILLLLLLALLAGCSSFPTSRKEAALLSAASQTANLYTLHWDRYANVTLAWDPSPSTGVVSYGVYWGEASRNYTKHVGNIIPCQVTLSNLLAGTVYYFAATAADAWGLESDYSEELVYVPPFYLRLEPGDTMTSGTVDAEYEIFSTADFQEWQLEAVTSTTNWSFTTTDPIKFFRVKLK